MPLLRSGRSHLAAVALVLVSVGGAAAAPCPEHFLHGDPPALTNPKLAVGTREICYAAFAVLYSAVTRTPLWAAEHLTRASVAAAERLERKNSFHAEPSLPKDERAELADYERSGFDRGHMAPDGDMPDPAAERESFSLANMVPQDPNLNRGLWARIEDAARDLAGADGEVYVVTGPIFRGERLRALHDRVLVPTEVYKAVYDPRRNQAGAYVAENAPGGEWKIVPVAELARLAGVEPFPSLPQAVKDKAMDLPEPTAHGRERQPAAPAERPPSWLARLLSFLKR